MARAIDARMGLVEGVVNGCECFFRQFDAVADLEKRTLANVPSRISRETAARVPNDQTQLRNLTTANDKWPASSG